MTSRRLSAGTAGSAVRFAVVHSFSLASTGHAAPRLAQTRLAQPRQPCPDPPHLAEPRQASPRLPCQASPNHDVPSRTRPRLPRHATPRRTPPCQARPRHACLTAPSLATTRLAHPRLPRQARPCQAPPRQTQPRPVPHAAASTSECSSCTDTSSAIASSITATTAVNSRSAPYRLRHARRDDSACFST